MTQDALTTTELLSIIEQLRRRVAELECALAQKQHNDETTRHSHIAATSQPLQSGSAPEPANAPGGLAGPGEDRPGKIKPDAAPENNHDLTERCRVTGKTVLLVEDEPFVRKLCLEVLSHLGYHTLEAASGEEALAIIDDQHSTMPDCLILDLTMPGLSGRETFVAVHQRCPDLPILLTSGCDREDALQQFAGLAPAGFLQKPYHLDALDNFLQSILG